MGIGRTADPAGQAWRSKRTVIMREVVNGLMYILSTGCQWRAIPKDLPPKSRSMAISICGHMTARWNESNHALYEQCREREQREASRPPPSSTARA